MELHEVTLAEYYNLQMIPRGLMVCLIPTLFTQNDDFKTKFAQIINKCSFDLITLMVQFLQQERSSLLQQMSDLETQLTELMKQEELTKINKSNKEKMVTFHKNIELWKQSKLENHRVDYVIRIKERRSNAQNQTHSKIKPRVREAANI